MIGERRSRDGWEVLLVLARLARIDTTSLVDAGGGLRVLPASLRPVRRGLRLVGRALTVDAREDLLSVVEGLRLSGPGDVLVVAGSDRYAVAGELFATEALRRGVAGMVIDGLCRDTRTPAELDLPVYARGTAPSACPARAAPVVQVPITIGAVQVRSGRRWSVRRPSSAVKRRCGRRSRPARRCSTT